MTNWPPSCALADVLALSGRAGWVDRHRLHPVAAPDVAVAGPARTVRIEPGRGSFHPLYELLSSPLEGAVIMVEATEVSGAVWGEILSLAAVASGALAAVIDGPVRDHRAVVASGLWLWGGAAQTVGPAGLANVSAIDEPIELGGVSVSCGDLVVLDADGVVVVAPDDPVLAVADGYADAEAAVVAALRAGRPLNEAYRFKSQFLAGLSRP